MPHTPGPWKVGQSRVSDDTDPFDTVEQLAIYNRADGVKVARVETWIGKQERIESESNAALIAAAPELLDALQYVVRYHREHDSGEGELYGLDFVTTCIGAIRKAEGRDL